MQLLRDGGCNPVLNVSTASVIVPGKNVYVMIQNVPEQVTNLFRRLEDFHLQINTHAGRTPAGRGILPLPERCVSGIYRQFQAGNEGQRMIADSVLDMARLWQNDVSDSGGGRG